MAQDIPADNGAEAFVELLTLNGVKHIFINPGTDTVPVQEALAKLTARGRPVPQLVLCLHEQVAMAAAHGYFLATGKPPVVLVHVDVGTQQVGGALHNAQRSRVGVVFCAGRSPSCFEGEKRGARTRPPMWYQEQLDQAGTVRNYVKWEYELRHNENIHHVVHRAFQVAASEPCGPVYLVLPQEVLMEDMKGLRISDSTRYAPASTPQADADTLDRVAGILLQAEKPLVIAGYSGRNPQCVASLASLAETLGARVVTSDLYVNIPTRHPLCAGYSAAPYVADADAILIVDHDVPYLPAQCGPKPGATIIQIDIDPIKRTIPMWGFPVDISVEADSSKAIPALNDIIRRKLTPGLSRRIQKRSRQIAGEHERQRAARREMAVGESGKRPVSPEWLARCIAEVIEEDAIVVTETVTSVVPVLHHLDRTHPGTLFGLGGSSLGWSLGAALGVKVASPDRLVVSLIGDGGFNYSCPTAALWASHACSAPLLCIVFNDLGYGTVRRNLRAAFGADNLAEKSGAEMGLDITPSPNYALMAESAFAHGDIVEDPSLVKTALQHALDIVRGGRSAVLDVRLQRP